MGKKVRNDKIFPRSAQVEPRPGKFGTKRTSLTPLSLVGLVLTRARLRFAEP